MTSPTSARALEPSPVPLLVATRRLAAGHALLGVGMIGLAVFMVIAYAQSSEEDNLAGVALIFGAAYALLGTILLALGVGSWRVGAPKASFGLGLAAGLLVLLAAGPMISLMLSGVTVAGPFLGIALEVAALALVICSIVGLVSRPRS